MSGNFPRKFAYFQSNSRPSNFGVYFGAKTCEFFHCFVAIVRVRVDYVEFFVSLVLASVTGFALFRRVLQVLSPRMSLNLEDFWSGEAGS